MRREHAIPPHVLLHLLLHLQPTFLPSFLPSRARRMIPPPPRGSGGKSVPPSTSFAVPVAVVVKSKTNHFSRSDRRTGRGDAGYRTRAERSVAGWKRGTCVYIAGYLVKARRETSARGSSACSCLVHSGPDTLVYVRLGPAMCARVCAAMRARPTQRRAAFSRCGRRLRGAFKARVCAQPPMESRPARPLVADGSFLGSASGVNHAQPRRNEPPFSPFHSDSRRHRSRQLSPRGR
jgi:hypothetical protein